MSGRVRGFGLLEAASGYIGFAQYAGYLWHVTPLETKLIAAAVGAVNLAPLLGYSRIPMPRASMAIS